MDQARQLILQADQLAADARYEEAIAAYEHAMTLSAALGGYRFVVGELHFELQRYGEAVKVFHDLTQRNPTDARAWEALGRALQLAGDLERAASVFDHACALAPGWGEAAYHAALCHAERGDDRSTEARLREAVHAEPRWLEAARDEGLLERFPHVLR